MWMALPGFALKALKCDTNFLVVNSMYVMHVMVGVIGDVYQFKLVKLLIGTREAILCLMCGLLNEYVKSYMLRTSANALEGNFMYLIMYYFCHLKPKLCDRSTLIMTFGLTLTFVCRSSSIIGYAPLAIFKIVEDPRYILSFIAATIIVVMPIMATTIAMDTYMYGTDKIMIPQINFIWVNIIEGISKHFGEMPIYWYNQMVVNEFCENQQLGFKALLLLSVQQYSGDLQRISGGLTDANLDKGHTVTRFPFILIYIVCYLIIHMVIPHKEPRFLITVFLLGQIAQAYIFQQFYNLRTLVLSQLQFIKHTWIYAIIKKITGIIIKIWVIKVIFSQETNRMKKILFYQYQKYDSAVEAYNLFHGRSELIPEHAHSIMFIDKFMQPNHLYMHRYPGDGPQTVVLYTAFRGPSFVPDIIKRQIEKGNLKI